MGTFDKLNRVVRAAVAFAGRVRLGLARVKEAASLVLVPRPATLKPATRPATPTAPGVPLGPSEHWARVARVVTTASERTRAIQDMQRSAASQLDAAGYGIEEIMYDLCAAGLLPQLVRAPALARPLPQSVPAAAPRAGLRPAA
jgi:hypothetical protein